MSLGIDQYDTKILNRFEIIDNLVIYLKGVLETYEKQKLADKTSTLTLNTLYNRLSKLCIEASSVSASYQTSTGRFIAAPEGEKALDSYQQVVESQSTLNKLEQYGDELQGIINEMDGLRGFKKFLGQHPVNEASWLNEQSQFTRLSYRETLAKYHEMYQQDAISFPQRAQDIYSCDFCRDQMTVVADTSELLCSRCGNSVKLSGTVFEDSQFYNQQGHNTKNKRYVCDKYIHAWAEAVQGHCVKSVRPDDLKVIDGKAVCEYTRGGVLRDMSDMRCRQMRAWFRELEMGSEYNMQTPYIRKIITGMHGKAVVPPQLTTEEQTRIEMKCSAVMKEFNDKKDCQEIRNIYGGKKVHNNMFYPYCMLKVLCHDMRGDPRLPGLIEGIHIQSENTLRKDDEVLKVLCKNPELELVYEPTDRTIVYCII